MGLKDTIESRVDKIVQRIEQFIIKFHRTYIVLISLFALIGYAFVFLFPALAIVSFHNIYEILLHDGFIDWQRALIWFVILLISVQLSYRMFVTRPVPAVGFTMPESKIPKIYAVIEELQSHFKRPVIHRIIISANYELDIIKTPNWMLPVWSSNTLVIGLPLLICLTPKQFEHMTVRRIRQFSKRHNMITNWLYQLNSIWEQYSYTYGKQKTIDNWVLWLFYKLYANLYKKFSVYVARADEFNADEYVMQLAFHEDICEMISADALSRWYLEKRYWPAIDKSYSDNPEASHQPYRKLVTVIDSILKTVTKDMLVNLAKNQIVERKSRLPSLQQRLKRIGYTAPQMEKHTGESAASYYLDTSLNGALNLMDKLWLKNKQKKLKKKGIRRSLGLVFE